MLLFEENESKEPPPKVERPPPTAAYLDGEHRELLDFIRGAVSPPLTKSEAIRQCIRLGARTLREQQARQSNVQKKARGA